MTAPGIMVIGSGTHFISGISHYTHALACALSQHQRTSVLLIRRLIPRRLYPGAARVGTAIADHVYPPNVLTYDGIDWFWIPSIFGAIRLLWSERPDTVVLQWWTGAVAHTYLLLVGLARLRGARIVFEMHEIQDTGEVNLPLVGAYTKLLLRLLTPLVDGFVIHSEADRQALDTAYRVGDRPVAIVRHGPYEQYSVASGSLRDAPSDVTNLMYFGTIRPYKGLEDLIAAFDTVPDPNRFWLTVVGETWENWTLPAELIAASPNRDRISFVNRYVTEDEAASWLAGADALVLPYHRSSASGPLHVGMALGLPIAVTDIPALVASAEGYEGCVFFSPHDVAALRDALSELATRGGTRYPDPASWAETARRFNRLIAELPPMTHKTTLLRRSRT